MAAADDCVWIAYSGYHNSDSCSDAPASIMGVYGGAHAEELAKAAIKKAVPLTIMCPAHLAHISAVRQAPHTLSILTLRITPSL